MTIVKDFEDKTKEEIIKVGKPDLKLIKLTLLSNKNNLTDHLLTKHNKNGELDSTLMKFFRNQITREVNTIVKDKASAFRYNNKENTDNIYYHQFEEMASKAPYLSGCVTSVAKSPKEHKNKIKTFDSCKPAIMNFLNTLLFCRSKNMNQCAVVNSVILKHGMADKECMLRMAGLHQCVSYTSVLDQITKLGKDFKKKVMS